jgi:hypothetical protein
MAWTWKTRDFRSTAGPGGACGYCAPGRRKNAGSVLHNNGPNPSPLRHAPERPAPDARPREKLLARGPGALGDAELLALLLRTGLAGKSVLQLAQELLEHFGGIAGLLHASADDLKRIKGLGGRAKRAELVAVLELARRALAEQLRERAALDTPQAVKHYLQLHLAARARGVCRAVSGQPAPADRAGRAVSRHADADQRLPARGGAARPAPPGQRWCWRTTTPAAAPRPAAPTRR